MKAKLAEKRRLLKKELTENAIREASSWIDLSKFPEDRRNSMAIILKNQREKIENFCPTISQEKKLILNFLAERVWGDSPLFNMIGVSPLLGLEPETIENIEFVPNDNKPVEISLCCFEQTVEHFEKRFSLSDLHDLEILVSDIHEQIFGEVCKNLYSESDTITVFPEIADASAESIYVKLSELSNIVHRKTLRGGCKWLVACPEIANKLAIHFGLPEYEPENRYSKKLGLINNRYQLIANPFFPKNEILSGYSGKPLFDNGYFFCPNLMMINDSSEENSNGFFLNYAKKLVCKDYYGRIVSK